MIKGLIAWGIGFACGVKYIFTRGLAIGAATVVPPTPLVRVFMVSAEDRTLRVPAESRTVMA